MRPEISVLDVTFGNLVSSEPLHKFSQPSRKCFLNWTVGNPQSLPKCLKFVNVQQLV